MAALPTVEIDLSHVETNLKLVVDEKFKNTIFDCNDAEMHGEARFQLVEGFSYDYEFTDSRYAFAKDQNVQPHSRKRHLGMISPNIYVGTLKLDFLRGDNKIGVEEIEAWRFLQRLTNTLICNN